MPTCIPSLYVPETHGYHDMFVAASGSGAQELGAGLFAAGSQPADAHLGALRGDVVELNGEDRLTYYMLL